MTQEALKISQKLHGEDSLQAADSLRSLCILPGDEGERTESRVLAQKVLKIRINHLVAASVADLAWTDRYVGKLKEAESLKRDALKIRRRLLGDKHPEVANSLSSLGQIMGSRGQLTDADAILSATYSIECKFLGGNNPDALHTLDALGFTLDKEGKWSEVEIVFNKALAA